MLEQPMNSWLTGVVRAARTRQEKWEEERAEHALCTCIQDEVSTLDVFPATSQGLEEGEPPTEKTGPEDDQTKKEDITHPPSPNTKASGPSP